MNTRNAMGMICQEGASNRHRVSRALHEAIEECATSTPYVDPNSDPAVFLILHQLVFLLTGQDITACGDLSRRYLDAMKAVQP